MTEHKLKTWPVYFEAILAGRKSYELRENDRNFLVGDVLVLEEFMPGPLREDGRYTGRSLRSVVTFITHGGVFGLRPGWCVLSLGAPR